MTSARARRRHPVRGIFGGILLGLGVILLLVLLGAAAFSSWVPFLLIFLGCVAVGALLTIFGPSIRTERH